MTNRITLPLASRLPSFAVIEHKGRKSGRDYRTPVNCWIEGSEAIVALTYGEETDWLRNLEASGCGTLVVRGRHVQFGAPIIKGDDVGATLPAPVRLMLNLLDVGRFAVLPLLSQDRPS